MFQQKTFRQPSAGLRHWKAIMTNKEIVAALEELKEEYARLSDENKKWNDHPYGSGEYGNGQSFAYDRVEEDLEELIDKIKMI